jgi:hypothetical protein
VEGEETTVLRRKVEQGGTPSWSNSRKIQSTEDIFNETKSESSHDTISDTTHCTRGGVGTNNKSVVGTMAHAAGLLLTLTFPTNAKKQKTINAWVRMTGASIGLILNSASFA